MRELSTYTIAQLSNNELRKNLTKVLNELTSVSNSQWSIAEAYNKIVNNKLYADDFRSLGELAECFNVNKSTVSRLSRAYDFAVIYDCRHFTVSAVAEMLPLLGYIQPSEIMDFLDTITPTSSTKEVREKVKAIVEQYTTTEEEHTEAEPTEEEPAEAEHTEAEPAEEENPKQSEPDNDIITALTQYRIGKKSIILPVELIRDIVTEYIADGNITI